MRPPAGDDAGGQLLPKKHCLVLFMAKLKMSPTLRIRDARAVSWSHLPQRIRQSGIFRSSGSRPHATRAWRAQLILAPDTAAHKLAALEITQFLRARFALASGAFLRLVLVDRSYLARACRLRCRILCERGKVTNDSSTAQTEIRKSRGIGSNPLSRNSNEEPDAPRASLAPATMLSADRYRSGSPGPRSTSQHPRRGTPQAARCLSDRSSS